MEKRSKPRHILASFKYRSERGVLETSVYRTSEGVVYQCEDHDPQVFKHLDSAMLSYWKHFHRIDHNRVVLDLMEKSA